MTNYFICMTGVILICVNAFSQSLDSSSQKVSDFPSRLLDRIHRKTSNMDSKLCWQTERYLRTFIKLEKRMQKKLYKVDSSAANHLFGHSRENYKALLEKMKSDSVAGNAWQGGEYRPNVDSLYNLLSFLHRNPQLVKSRSAGNEIQGALSQFKGLQARMKDAEVIKHFIKERKEQIGNYLSQHNDLSKLFGGNLKTFGQDQYYFSQQLMEYKELLNRPDKLQQKALAVLNQLPEFGAFLKEHSQLAGLFNLPGNYGSPDGVQGLQTRDQVNQVIQNQLSAGGAGGATALQSNLSSAESQLDGFKDKLNKMGVGSADMDMPDFKPNDQKTRSFLNRLEYGTSFQTTKGTSLFPAMTDLGLSVAYKLGHNNTVGIGTSYKIGWGRGWNHIAFTSQGVGLRSFLDVKLKGAFFISAGLEYNYTTPFTSLQQIDHINYWTPDGLIGISKTVCVRGKVFKKTKLQLLWDLLSYQQVPRKQPILFRIAYGF